LYSEWEEMERFYQDLSQALKQVPKGDMLLLMGDFNAKEPSAMSSAVGLYGLGETNEASEQLEDFCLEHELALANTMFKQHPRRLYTWTSPDGKTQNQIDYISIAHRWKTSLMNCPLSYCLNVNVMLSIITFLMIFHIFDPSPLTIQINCNY